MPRIAGNLLVALAAAWACSAGAPRGSAESEAAPPGASPEVTMDLAVTAARQALVKQGFDVLRVEIQEGRHVVFYRDRGGWLRREPKGPPSQLVLREVGKRVVLGECPKQVREAIGLELGVKL
jgi:hypothetical protein